MSINPGILSDIQILFIDPDESFCDSARRVLEKRRFAVSVAHDATLGLSMYSPKFQVVVAAMSVAPRGGLELLREIKARNSETQVVLLGETGSLELAGAGLRDGAFAYLLKPFDDFLELTHTVDRAVELQQLRWQAEHPRYLEATGDKVLAEILANALRQMVESTRHAEPLPKTLQILLKTSRELYSAKHAFVLLSSATGVWRMAAANGFEDQESAARNFMENIGDDFAWRVVTERKTCTGIRTAEISGSTPIHFVGTPLIARGQVLGVVITYTMAEGFASGEWTQWFEAFASQGAVAVELSRLYEENERLSPVDSLTGLLKKKNFMELADREFRRCWRYNEPLTAILLDVDGMNEINSKVNFDFGNRVLRDIGEACRRSIRAVDLICRFEKDSFVILMPMANADGAQKATERLRTIIQTLPISDEQGMVQVTATFGVSTYPRPGCTSIQELIGLAQTAQQNARRNGPSQISLV